MKPRSPSFSRSWVSLLPLAALALALASIAIIRPWQAFADPATPPRPSLPKPSGVTTSPNIVINEVWNSNTPAYQYVEFYNRSVTETVDLAGYVIFNKDAQASLAPLPSNKRIIGPGQWDVITAHDLGTPTIVGNGIASYDYLALVNSASEDVVDVVNWGGPPNPGWFGYGQVFPYYFRTNIPSMPPADGPNSLSRYPDGYDTDSGLDWRVLPTSPGYSNGPPPTAIPTPGPPPTPCAVAFSDVHPTDYFYLAVSYLYCRGAISGYADGTFRPYYNITRSQVAKIVTLGFGIPIWMPLPSATPTFSDVPRDHPFFAYVETVAHYFIVSGYQGGTFRPYTNATRAQLTKMIVRAGGLVYGWQLIAPSCPTFSDVPLIDPFYVYIETAYCHGAISGYADGTFRPGYWATRGQVSKMEYEALFNRSLCAPSPVPTGVALPVCTPTGGAKR